MDQKSGKPSQKRRAILQGSLAAPVVLTVSSASATTMTTLGRCMTNIGTEQPSAFFLDLVNQSKDKWFRRPVTVVKLSKDGVQTDWLYFDHGFNDYVLLASPLNKTGYFAQTGWTQTGQSTRWALVWLNSTGAQPYTQIQVERPTSAYQVSTTTCACSVNPALLQG